MSKTLLRVALLGLLVGLVPACGSSGGDTIVVGGGPGTFNVQAAGAIAHDLIVMTFDGTPNAVEAVDAAHYDAPGLVLSDPQLIGNSVTLRTFVQTPTTYTLTVTGVTRASDGAALTLDSADFSGRTSFNVQSAASLSPTSISVTFDAPPSAAAAGTLGNYSIPGLTLSGVPSLVGSTVTITTTTQVSPTYTVTVSNVTRASDGEPLLQDSADFSNTPVTLPTVTNVVVSSTSPNNGTTPYNTGTTTVVITGTDFTTVTAPNGVALDDLDGAGGLVGTAATTYTVDTPTQITATFPAGIRTKAGSGWNVIVTNAGGSNVTSSVRFEPVAGLLISEVYPGATGSATHEFVEIYNPTGTTLDVAALGLRLHARSSTGTDSNKTLTLVGGRTSLIISHGFMLFSSTDSTVADAWYGAADYLFVAAFAANCGAYISLSPTANAKVLDKVGWGTQPAPGFEGSACPAIPSALSLERKPASGAGHATDTDDNSADLLLQAAPTPRGTTDAAQP